MNKNIRTIVLYVLLAFMMFLIFSYVDTQKNSRPKVDIEMQKKYANVLVNKGLYKQAINEYSKLIEVADLNQQKQANIMYIIGNIYMDNLHDYENALANYLKVELLSSESELASDVKKRKIECLDRLGKTLEAQREMESVVGINSRKISKGEVVAKIRKRKITMGELLEKLNEQPPALQEYYRNKKLEFLKQYIATMIMYDAAKRRNYDSDKDVLKKAEEARRQLMVQKLIEEEIKPKIKVSDSDIELYYKAHKDEFKDKKKVKKLDEVRDEIRSILRMQKEQDAVQEFLNKQLKAEKVTIYEDLFKEK